MKNKWKKYLPGILASLGAFYLFLPHTLHHRFYLDFGLPHGTHQIIGLGLLAIGAYCYFKKK